MTMPTSPGRIVFFGDSICVGQGVSVHHSWAVALSRMVEARFLGGGLPPPIVTNASVNGNTTRMALERMPSDVQQGGVDILYVQFGLNDCNRWITDKGRPRVSRKAFAANLEEIIERGRVFGARRVLIATNHPTARAQLLGGVASSSFEDQRRLYNAEIRMLVANDPALTLVDLESAFMDHLQRDGVELSHLLLQDGLHLSERGHRLYERVISHSMRTVLDEVIGSALSSDTVEHKL